MRNFEIEMKKVSIIIPVYNRADVVVRTLESVVSQSYRPIELLLVDNGSTDDTRVVLEQFKIDHSSDDFTVLVLDEPCRTAGAARNTGFDRSTGEWVMFFDSDDIMRPRLVERHMQLVEQNDGLLDITVVRRRFVDARGGSREGKIYKSDHLANHLLHSTLSTQAYCVRREFFASCGGWNAELPAWNDFELGLRLLLAGPRMAWHDGRPLVDVMSSGEGSITGTGFLAKAGQWEKSLEAMAEDVKSSELSSSTRTRLLNLLAYRLLVLGAHYEREGDTPLARDRVKQAMTRLSKKWLYRKTMPWLFRRVVEGKGAGAIARIIIR